MGTKNDPGKFDCYKAAEPDEPMFVLLGRDPVAPMVVLFWARLRKELGEDPDSEKIQEAVECANALMKHAVALSPEKADKAFKAMAVVQRIVRSGP